MAILPLPNMFTVPHQPLLSNVLLPITTYPKPLYNHAAGCMLPETCCRFQYKQAHFSEKSIGYGAFGVVWLVVDPRTGEKVALKRIRGVFNSLTSAKRVFRELYLLLNLKHSNVVQLLDIVNSDPASFHDISVLCEYMDTDLHKIISSSQPLSVGHVQLFLYQILRGVKYLHSAGVIHRDLKPGNLLVNSNGLVKICDFGLARTVNSISDDTDSDQAPLTGEVVTQFYRAPELLLGCAHYTSAIDLWSVGCILAELLTRRILFNSTNIFRHLEMIFNLIGTPTHADLDELVGIPSSGLDFLFNRPMRSTNLAALVSLITALPITRLPHVGVDAVYLHLLHLLVGLLAFCPSKRLTAQSALQSPFLHPGRVQFHTRLCSCCPRVSMTSPNTPLPIPVWMNSANRWHSIDTQSSSSSSPVTPSPHSALFPTVHPYLTQVYSPPLLMGAQIGDCGPEPVVRNRLNTEWNFNSIDEAKIMLWTLIQDYFRRDMYRSRVVLNSFSPNFESFIAPHNHSNWNPS